MNGNFEFREWFICGIFRSLKVSCTYGYSVTFTGVGKDPSGSEHLGYCSQIAVFVKNQEQNGRRFSSCPLSNVVISLN